MVVLCLGCGIQRLETMVSDNELNDAIFRANVLAIALIIPY